MLPKLSTMVGVSLSLLTNLCIVHASPIDRAAPTVLDHKANVSLSPDYLSAWSTVLNAQISTTGQVLNQNPTTSKLTKRPSPLGQVQYVSVIYRKARWYISIVTVLNTWAALPDPFTETANIATAVAQSSRAVIGAQHDRWAVAAWSFFSNVQADQFTCVSRLVFPRNPNMYDYDEIRRFAITLAQAWGIDTRIPYFYPVNGNLKRDGDAGNSSSNSTEPENIPKVVLYSNWKPTQDLADKLLEKFGDGLPPPPAAAAGAAGVASARKRDYGDLEWSPWSGMKGICGYGIDTARRIAATIPWDTIYDEGCLGSLSDFT